MITGRSCVHPYSHPHLHEFIQFLPDKLCSSIQSRVTLPLYDNWPIFSSSVVSSTLARVHPVSADKLCSSTLSRVTLPPYDNMPIICSSRFSCTLAQVHPVFAQQVVFMNSVKGESMIARCAPTKWC